MINRIIPFKIRHAVQLALHAGDNYSCPFCGYDSKDFSSVGIDIPVLKEKEVIGAGKRKAGCYKCGSRDRERLVFVYLRDKLNILENKQIRILHLAPEKRIRTVLHEMNFENYICGDLFMKGYSYPDYVQNMNVLNLPFEDNYFDVVICNHLLEHVPNDIDAMKELFRVLKKNGEAILQVPISKNSKKTYEDFSITNPEERIAAFGQFDHVRIYGQDYVNRLSSVGFIIERLNISSAYPKYGLNPEEDLFIGRK